MGQQQQSGRGNYNDEAKGLNAPGALAVVTGALTEAKGKFLAAAGDVTIFMRENEFAMQVMRRNSYTADVARRNPTSLRDAIIQAGVAGVSLNPTMNHAYLVPRDGMICLDVGFRGLRDTAIADGILRWCRADVVYETDRFEVVTTTEGDRIVDHQPTNYFGDRGKKIGGYCEWEEASGHRDCVTESMQELYDSHRSRSVAWTKQSAGIWKTDENEAIKKSLIKRAHKSWPRTTGMGQRFDAAMSAAIHADDQVIETAVVERIDDARLVRLTERAGKYSAKWCEFYKVETLSDLTPAQADDMEKRLDAQAKRIADEKTKAEAKAAKAGADETKATGAETKAPPTETPAVDVDTLWREIDDGLAVLADGDMTKADEIASSIRKAAGLPKGDLTAEQVGKFHAAVAAQVNG